MANRRFIDFPIATTVGDSDIILIWQSGVNKQTTKATFLSGLPENLDELNDVAISGLTNGQILRYDSVTGKWENTDQGNLDLNDLNDVSIVSPSNGQVLVYNSSTSKWENSSGGFVPYVGAVTTVDLGAQGLRAGYVRFDTSVASVPNEQGLMYWDASRSTAALIMNGTLQHIGQDTFFYVKNSSGSTIPKGTCVRFAGTDGASGHLLIAPFLANGSVPSSYFMGVTAEAIANGSFGQVMHFGELEGINTSGFTAGALLYASTTVAGGFQTTVPVAPNNIVLVAAAVNSKNNGAIIVRPQIGSNINNDEGVKITSPTTGDLLQLQAGGLWENKTKAQILGGTSSQFVKGDGSLDSTSYQPLLTNPVTGTGTTNYLPKFTGSTTIGNSIVQDAGIRVDIGGDIRLTPSSAVNIQAYTGSVYTNLFYNAASHNWQTSGGATKMFLNSNDNLLIGTTSDNGARLQVSGNVYIARSSNPYLTIDDTGVNSEGGILFKPSGFNSKGGLTINYSTAEQRLFVGEGGNSYFQTFYTNGSPRMTISSSGNVGIGTNTSLSSKLIVNGSIANGHNWGVSGSTFNIIPSANGTDGVTLSASYWSDNYGPIKFNTSDTERMRITSGGNVWVGNDSNPLLEIANGGSTDVLSGIRWSIGGSRVDYGGIYSATSSANNNYISFYTKNSASAPSERMRITSGGNVGIGTASPSTQFVISNGGAQGIEMWSINSVSGGAFLQTYNRSANSFYDFDLVANNLIFRTGQSYNPSMTITSGGNVLIGTTTDAGSRLHVVGSSLTNTFRVTDAANYTICMGYEGTGNIGLISTLGSTASLALGTNSTARLTIASTGAANFSNSLRIQGSTVPTSGSGTELAYDGTNGYLLAYNRTSSVYLPLFVQGSSLSFGTGDGTTKMLINSSGNVGIGTPSPNVPLEIQADSGGTAIRIKARAAANSGTLRFFDNASSTQLAKVESSDNSFEIGSLNNVFAAFLTNATERMRITSAGDLMLKGRSTTTNYEAVFYNDNSQLAINANNTSVGKDINFNHRNDLTAMRITSTGETLVGGTTDNGAYNLQCNGTGVWGAGAYVNGSDRNIKDNIATIEKGLEYIQKMNPVKFRYKPNYTRDHSMQTGFIAQELQEVFASEDYLSGLVQQGVHLSVAYQNLLPVLVKAIQEQQEIINDLKQRIQ